jgi:transposase
MLRGGLSSPGDEAQHAAGVFCFAARLCCGLEANGSAHHWARELIKLKHAARIIPPAYVKRYIRRQKNDAADAAAICEDAAFDAVCRRALAEEPGDVDASQDAGDVGR